MSQRAAGQVAKRGYANLKIFINGIKGWTGAGYSLNTERAVPDFKIPLVTAAQLKASLDKVAVVDIRPRKFRKKDGWNKDSKQIPLGIFSKTYGYVPRNKKVVIVDHNGKRSRVACLYLKSKGYKDISQLKGGMKAWKDKGYPLVK